MWCVRCKQTSIALRSERHPICPHCYRMEGEEVALIEPNGANDA